jgi:pimeloyl-ACP methyl ester carboxylesterase
MKQMFTADIVSATRYGLRGPVHDVFLFARPWGFSPRALRVPIRFWHGDADMIVPLSHSEHLASIMPDAGLTVVPGLGHFAGFVNVSGALDQLVALWAGRRRINGARARR